MKSVTLQYAAVLSLLIGASPVMAQSECAFPYPASEESRSPQFAVRLDNNITLVPVPGDVNQSVARVSLSQCDASSIGVEIQVGSLPAGWSAEIVGEGGAKDVLSLKLGRVLSWPVRGDRAELIVRGPTGSAGELDARVTAVFAGLPKSAEAKSAAVPPVNFLCKVEEDPSVEPLGMSVLAVLIDGVALCSGTLINHRASDSKAIAWTSAHCGDPAQPEKDLFELAAEGAVLARPYAQAACGQDLEFTNPGGPGSITSVRTLYADYGADGMASQANDHWLVEMDQYPPVTRPLLLRGYSFDLQPDGSRVSAVHHAGGNSQQWLLADIIRTTALAGPHQPFDRSSHSYDTRSVEGCSSSGSSGSSLVNEQGVGIGVLHVGATGLNNECENLFSSFFGAKDDPLLRDVLIDDSMPTVALNLSTPTPTATPTASPTPTVTPSVTPTPGPSVDPAPTTTPTPTSTPAVTPTPGPVVVVIPSQGGGALGGWLVALLMVVGLGRRLRLAIT